MNRYKFQHRITTISELYVSFEYRGFTFSPWNDDPFKDGFGGAWLAEKVVEAKTVNEANEIFHDNLNAAVNRIAFVSQCFTWVEFEPFLILRLNENENRRLYFKFSYNIGPGPLIFSNSEIAALESLESYSEKGDVFRCLREAGIAPSFYSRMAMLSAALDALAAQDTNKKGSRISRREYINDKILMDEELSNALYENNDGIRHNVIHGERVDWNDERHNGRNYVQGIYGAILKYFRNEHGVEIEDQVVGPMRNPIGNYRGWRGWVEPKDAEIGVVLRSMNDAMQFSHRGEGDPPARSFTDMFEYCDGAQENY